MSSISLVVGLAGSAGLLLLGLRTATDGVRVAGGSMLVGNLWRWTCDRRRSLATGAVGGALLPASGPLTQTGYGLAGARLLGTRHALWLLVGAGLGATLAAGTVAVLAELGPALRLAALSVLTAGVGMQLAGRDSRWSSWGTGLAGLGLAGIGLDVLASTFADWSAVSTYPGLDVAMPVRIVVCAILGATLGYALQSASLSLAAVLLACGAGLLAPASGFGWALGIPVGGALRSIPTIRRGHGGARRAATLHAFATGASVLLGAGLVACSLPLLLAPPAPLNDPVLFVGLFALACQAASAGVMVAVDAPLARLLEEQWPDDPEAAAADGAGLFAVPELARQALADDVHRIGVIGRDLARAILGGSGVTDFRVREDLARARAEEAKVEEEGARLVASAPPFDVARAASILPHAARLQVRLCEELAHLRAGAAPSGDALGAPLRSRMRQCGLAVLHLVEGSDPLRGRFSERELDGELRTIEAQMHDLRLRILALHRQSTIGPEDLDALLVRTDRLLGIAHAALAAGRELDRALPESPGAAEPVLAARAPAAAATPTLADTATRVRPNRLARGEEAAEVGPTPGGPFDPEPVDPAMLDRAGAALPRRTGSGAPPTPDPRRSARGRAR